MIGRRCALGLGLVSVVVAGCKSTASVDSAGDGAPTSAPTDDTDTDTDTDTDAETGPDLPDPVCTEGTRWSPGTQAFVEVTDDWGLTDIGPDGVWISAVDVDGDGWTDLVVRTTAADDLAAGDRNNWLLRNDGAGHFVDVTEASGLWAPRADPSATIGRAGWAMVFADVDNDGDLDAYSGLPDGTVATETSEIYLNRGDGTFELGPEGADFRALTVDIAYGVSFSDVDRDGHIDLWAAQYSVSGWPFQDQLYAGDGTGNFNEITSAAGLSTEDWVLVDDLNAARSHTNAWSAATCDLNADGWPELLASSYGRAPNHLWQNLGDGMFLNRSVESGYAFDQRVDWTDNESARCFCKLHPDEVDCAGVPEPEYTLCNSDADILRWDHDFDREPFRLGGNSGSTVCADVDNDGMLDLLTTEIVHWDVGSSSDPAELAFNTGAGDVTFERPGAEATGMVREHVGIDWNDGDMSGGIFDFDNDGWPDVYIGGSDYPDTRGLLFHQESARSFSAVPLEDGIDHTRSHGFVSADFDRDGDLDVVVGHSSARCEDDCYDTFVVRMFENRIGQDGNWVQLRLDGGEDANRAAIGARIEVTADGVTQTNEVDGGHGIFGTQSDLIQHFGLGAACEAEVTIRWPDAAGTVSSFPVVSGYRFAIAPGADPVAESPL
jgi:hypothetical protein